MLLGVVGLFDTATWHRRGEQGHATTLASRLAPRLDLVQTNCRGYEILY